MKASNFVLSLVLSLVSAAILVLPGFAKSEFTIVTLTSPDWFSKIEITDRETLAALNLHSFLEVNRTVQVPADLGRGILLTRGYGDRTDLHAYDRLLYFPGSPGIAYYLENFYGVSRMDGNWYQVSESGQATLLSALEAKGARISALPAQNGPAGLPTANIPALMITFGFALIGGGVTGWLLRGARLEKSA